jgi:hypothetical protein
MPKTLKLHRSIEVDMSSEALERRMCDLAQLYRLGISIQSAKYLGKVKDVCAGQGQEKPDSEELPQH